MRNLTVKRVKSFVASLMKMKVYIEDPASGEITKMTNQFRRVLFKVKIKCLCRQLIHLQPNSMLGRWIVPTAIRSISKADDSPIARRCIPTKDTIPAKTIRDIANR